MIDRRKTDLVRPRWDYNEYHRNKWRDMDVTAIMCEKDTDSITKLTIESLLRFYPDLPLLVIDGGSSDDSVMYLKRKAAAHPNIQLWERQERNGHGTMLDEGIRNYIRTKYVLLLDSDLLILRGGWLEEMLAAIKSEDIYAIGTLMQVSYSGDGCGEPKDDSDILRYTHPSCALIRVEQYLTMRPFVEHGAPLYANMQDAQDRRLRVEYYPVELYMAHLSGASWCDPRPIWINDMGITVRPFFTIIASEETDLPGLMGQIAGDFDIIPESREPHKEKVVIHDLDYFEVNNKLYQLRHRVTGDYICSTPGKLPNDTFLKACKETLILEGMPEEKIIEGFTFTKRQLWQQRNALL